MNKNKLKTMLGDFALCAIATVVGLTLTIALWCCLIW